MRPGTLRRMTGAAISALGIVLLLVPALAGFPFFLCASALFSLGERIYGEPPASFRLSLNLPEGRRDDQ